MNRRLFLRMMAGAAASLGLAKLPRAAKPDTLLGIPVKYEKPRETRHTEWIKCGRYASYKYVLYLDETCLEALPSFKLPAADRGWHTIEFEEPTIDLVAMNAAERTLAAMLRERADLEEEA